uniref:At1g61320/AtMIF1 LRR domain-containing protein n=1 Tax=Triticum urartu TaxID=4572 RepID=A0A8R7QGF6_TRIUA
MLRYNLLEDTFPAAAAQQPACINLPQTADIKIEAPNIYRFCFITFGQVDVSLGESLRLKNLEMFDCRPLCYALEELPSIAPNLETFSIYSPREVVNTRMALAPSKFLHLKYLSISIHVHGDYDYFSLVSFLGAAPSFETFILNVQTQLEHTNELLSEDPSHLRKMLGCRHDKLKEVKISRFYPSKSLVELTCHILETTSSLECLTLDTAGGGLRCSDREFCKCSFLDRTKEARKAVLVIRKYIVGKVRSRVKLDAVE